MGLEHLSSNFGRVGHNRENPQQMLQAIVCQSAVGLYPAGEFDLKSASYLRTIVDKLGGVRQERQDVRGEGGFSVFDTLLVLEISALNEVIATNCPRTQTQALERIHRSHSLASPKLDPVHAERSSGYSVSLDM